MTPSRRRVVLFGALALFAAAFAWAYWLSLVPATHPDHDHGILNLDAGGRLNVTTREGKTRNLVGRPGKALVVHFFSSSAPGAAEELAGLFRLQEELKADPGVDFVLVAHDRDFATLDAWLKQKGLVAPAPATLVLDPTGDTTNKLNSKRPLETMFFTAEGKLSSQARGALEWPDGAMGHLARARGGEAIE
ncbi:MAG TPA: hypothetical protein VLJ18_08680 [Thermoanaerobaculia bacterium]|nr:hypothetical protein [Thermoanaerobaculia bacterium]